ncbi:MAG TPA: hypothetical protein VF627_11870 [Abditibacterium sp.]
MAISRKPKAPETPAAGAVNVDALIAKGGSVAQLAPQESEPASPQEAERSVTSFTLRVPHEILEGLDTHRKKQSYKVPRQQWILEAIMQRIERETTGETPKD